MDHISTILPPVLRKRGLKDEADASLCVHKAQEWLTAQNLEATAKQVKEGTLLIAVQSSVAAQECSVHSEELLTFLHNELSGHKLERIRLIRA